LNSSERLQLTQHSLRLALNVWHSFVVLIRWLRWGLNASVNVSLGGAGVKAPIDRCAKRTKGHVMRRPVLIAVGLMTGVIELGLSRPAAAQSRPPGPVHTIALTNTAAPAGGDFLTLDVPVVNELGQVAFHAQLNNGTSLTGAGVFVGAPGSLEAAALRHSAAPLGGNYGQFYFEPVLNNSGQVAFVAALSGETTNSGGLAGVFLGTPGDVEAVAIVDEPAPGGGIFSYFRGRPAINDSGQVAFAAGRRIGASSTDGVFVGTHIALNSIALVDTPAPGGGSYIGFRDPTLNNAGQVAFSAAVMDANRRDGLFIGTPQSVQAIALGDTPAPAGGNYGSEGLPFSPEIDASGQVAFWGTLKGGASNQGLFAGHPGNLQAVALQGTPAPIGQDYAGFSGRRLNIIDMGQVAFEADLTSGSEGIFVGEPSALRTLVARGDPAPLGGNFNSFGSPLADDTGQIVFVAGLTGFGVTPLNRSGLYVWSNGRLMKIARTGDQIDVDAGPGMDFRIVHEIRLHENSGGDGGRASSFSSNGYLTYRLTFTDSTSGIFLRQLVQLPGDFDANGIVNASDYQVWKANYGSTTNLAADGNHDQIVDTADYILWRDNLGRVLSDILDVGLPAPALVPEPAAQVLLVVGMISLFVIVGEPNKYRPLR
jgi:hypothetical protein